MSFNPNPYLYFIALTFNTVDFTPKMSSAGLFYTRGIHSNDALLLLEMVLFRRNWCCAVLIA